MVQIWICLVILALLASVNSNELLPERYLQPQDFNHHPFTDVGLPPSLKKASKLTNPYALLAKKRLREGREFPPQDVVFYPTPHPSVISRKEVETNEIGKHDHHVSAPKNYAFSYIVKDHHSGDDFSHSQAHNGKATRGQYRVKLPDGRTQIVSYTADHKGYRAEVQYEEDLVSKPSSKTVFQTLQNIPETPAKLPEILPNTYQHYPTAFIPKHIPPVNTKLSDEVIYSVTPSYKTEFSNYLPKSHSSAPLKYVPESTALKLLVSDHAKSAVAPQYYHPHYSQNYIVSTPAPFLQKQYVSSTTAQYLPQQYISSTALHPVMHVSTTAAPPIYEKQQFQNNHYVSSTIAPQQQAVIVTPRPIYNKATGKHGPQSSVLLYRLV